MDRPDLPAASDPPDRPDPHGPAAPDPDAWDPDRFVAEQQRSVRPNRDALGQSLRAACLLMVATLLGLSVVLVPEIDRAVRALVNFVVLPLLLSAGFTTLVAGTSQKPWTPRAYLVGVGGFGAVVIAVVLLVTAPS